MAKPDFFFYAREQGTMSGNVLSDADIYNVHTIACPGINPTADGQVEFNISAQAYADCWASFYTHSTALQTGRPIAVLKGATTELLRIATTGTAGDTVFQYWNGSAWVTIGSALGTNLDAAGSGASTRFDIHCKLHGSTGEFKVYVDGVDKATLSGNTLFTADTTANALIFRAGHASFDSEYGHIFVDSVDTRGLFVDNGMPSSNGTYAEWNGGEPDVDNIMYAPTYANEFATGDAHGKRMLLNFGSIAAAYSGFTVEGVVIAWVGQAVAEPAFYLKPITRVASDYAPPGSVQPTSPLRLTYGFRLDNNPATGAPWASQAAVNGQQMGLIVSNTA